MITGYLLKLARESTGLSQEALAEQLGADAGTVQGWETARRPFTSVGVGKAVSIRHRMLRLGANPVTLAALDDAAEADWLLTEIAEAGTSPPNVTAHPLGHLVLTHRLADLVSWAITAVPPGQFADQAQASRRGPSAPAPQLDAGQKAAFFAGLQAAAEHAAGRDDPLLLHRQACYLAGMDPALATWLSTVATRSEYFVRPRKWTPQWADARSVATGLARQGDPEPLRAFIRHNTDRSTELAALNYGAYWAGEFGQQQSGDQFMTDPNSGWRGAKLLRHIVDRLTPGHGFLDLNVHTLWSLLLERRAVIHDDPATSRTLARRGAQLLDQPDVISPQSSTELTSVLYGLRAEGISA
ncbi:MAG: hypothetical protein QOJ50_1098 [Cryptosporangiaceae bacterium]|nr:hypothetical protein [Cryptosporangiaceae bacterium]